MSCGVSLVASGCNPFHQMETQSLGLEAARFCPWEGATLAYTYRLGDKMLENSPKERDLQVLIDSKLLNQDSGHSTKPDGGQEVLGQCSQTHSLILFYLLLCHIIFFTIFFFLSFLVPYLQAAQSLFPPGLDGITQEA